MFAHANRGTVENVSVADLLANWACAQTASPAFTLAGQTAWPLIRAVSQRRTIVGTTTETTAGYIADGFARATGIPGIVIVSAGPALANLLTPLATAQLERQPMIVLFGTTAERAPKPAFQDSRIGEWNSVASLNAIGVQCIELTSTSIDQKQIRTSLAAAEDALTGRRPVVIAVPSDVAQSLVPGGIPAANRTGCSNRVSLTESPTVTTATRFDVGGVLQERVSYQSIAKVARANLDNFARVIVDAGTARQAACEVFRADEFIHAETSAPMGWGIGAGIGAAIACSPRRVLAICGDGSALLAGNEMATCARYRLPITLVVCANGVLGSPFSEFPEARSTFAGMPTVDWATYWQSLGVEHTNVRNRDHLAELLRSDGQPLDGPRVLTVRTPAGESGLSPSDAELAVSGSSTARNL